MTSSPTQPSVCAARQDGESWRRQVAIARSDGSFCVRAVKSLAAGDVVLHLDGMVTNCPSRFSVQVGPSCHIEIPTGATLEEQLDRFPWRFLNHACEPNAGFRGRELVATRSIECWEEISFDYTTTEYEMAVPFGCGCGAQQCLGTVSGYRGLCSTEQRRRLGRLAPYLLRANSDAS